MERMVQVSIKFSISLRNSYFSFYHFRNLIYFIFSFGYIYILCNLIFSLFFFPHTKTRSRSISNRITETSKTISEDQERSRKIKTDETRIDMNNNY